MDMSIIETGAGSILRNVIGEVLDGAGLAILRGPAGIGKSFALDLIVEDLRAKGVIDVRVTVSPANGGSISAFTQAVLSQYRIETGSTADSVEAVAELLAGYPFSDAGPAVVFVVDEAQELKPAILEVIRSLWDRGTDARLGLTSGPAFGCILVGNEMFMGKGGNLRVARFRRLMSRVTHNVQLPRPDKAEIAALAVSLFPDQRELSGELQALGAITGNLRALAVAARQSRLAAKGEAVTLPLLRRVIRVMGGK